MTLYGGPTTVTSGARAPHSKSNRAEGGRLRAGAFENHAQNGKQRLGLAERLDSNSRLPMTPSGSTPRQLRPSARGRGTCVSAGHVCGHLFSLKSAACLAAVCGLERAELRLECRPVHFNFTQPLAIFPLARSVKGNLNLSVTVASPVCAERKLARHTCHFSEPSELHPAKVALYEHVAFLPCASNCSFLRYRGY